MFRSLRPTYVAASFGDISPELLSEQQPGLKALTHDIDGYLVGYSDDYDSVPEKHLKVIDEAHRAGLLQAIITNTGATGHRAQRSRDIANHIREVVGLEALPVINPAIPGCSKKPNISMFTAAAKILRVTPSEICHGGDQMTKDVLGANRAGYGATILTARFGDSDHNGVKFLQRPLEAGLRPLLDLPLLQASFPETMTNT